MDIKDHIRQMPDFPKPGILFYDISTLLAHAGAWQETVDELAEVLAPTSRTCWSASNRAASWWRRPWRWRSAAASSWCAGSGKLPGPTMPYSYDLEYGTDTIEIQADAIKPGHRVVVLDDLLATGGTLSAAINLCRKVGADVRAAACIVELTFLDGRSQAQRALHLRRLLRLLTPRRRVAPPVKG